jgi:1,4-dihydroxy-2-naphthoate octaprenyltransferase
MSTVKKIMARKTLTTWIIATRPQFFTVIILPIFLGTAIAWHSLSVFSPAYFILSLVAGIFSHAGINVLNDYFDHLNQSDDINLTPLTPFTGGSRFIQQGILSPQETYYYGWFLLTIAIIIGLLLVWLRGLPLLWIGLIGILSGYCYSAPPFSFHSRGLGEMLVGLNFGLLTVVGSYYVQTQTLNGVAMIAALPLSGLVTAILYLNEFPDYLADKRVGKHNLVVRLGKVTARHFLGVWISLSFVVIVVGVISQNLPLLSLISFLALPLGWGAIKNLYIHYDNPPALILAIKNTIWLHTVVSGILILAFIFPI